MGEFVHIKTFSNRLEAELAQNYLRVSGVEAKIDSDDAGGMYPQLPLVTGGAKLYVPADKAEIARSLLAEKE